jgi:hypothetical protein
MGKYDGLTNTAASLIARKGGLAKLTHVEDATFDPVTQQTTSQTRTYDVQAVGLPPSKGAEYRIGSLLMRNVLEFQIAQKGLSVRPMPGDKLRWAGYDWRIIWSTTYDPAADGSIMTTAYGER